MQHGLGLLVYGQRGNMAGRVGTCEQADFGGDCDSGTLGAWQMQRGTLGSCVSWCEACARCIFVSFSRVNSDVRVLR